MDGNDEDVSAAPSATTQLLESFGTLARRWSAVAETVLIAGLGGFLFDRAGFPAGWLAGAMMLTAAAALAGRTIVVPSRLARACFITVGITIGGTVTPETVRGFGTWPLSIVMVSIAMAAVTMSTSTYLRRVHGWERLTALFAGIPGALSQVVALAAEENCDLRAIAIVQTVRVVILAVGIPAGLALSGLAGPTRLAAGSMAITEAPGELLVLVGLSIVVGLGLLRLGLPGGLIFGPLVVSAVLHGGGFIGVKLPMWAAVTGMAGLGAVNGSRFTDTPARLLLEYLGAALGSFVIAVVVGGTFAVLVTWLLTLPISEVIVAYAPGSVDAMMIMALALHLDPVFVGAHHLARVLTVSLVMPFVVRHTAARRGAHPPESGVRRRPPETDLDD